MIERIVDTIKSAFKRIPQNKRYIVYIAAGVLLMIIIAMPETSLKNKKTDTVTEVSDEKLQSDYIAQTEEKLCDLIASIKGAGKTKVMITLDCTQENIYASDINTDKTEYVVIKTDSGENGMLLKVVNPKIRGVAVVCEGGDIPRVKVAITNAVCTSLGIKSTKISIAKMKDRSD